MQPVWVCPPRAALIKLERLRLGGDEPFAIETCYLSADEFAGLTRARLDRVSLFSILEHDYGLRIAHADEEVDATTADPQTARLLGISAGIGRPADPAGDLFHERQGRVVRVGALPIGPPYVVNPQIPLATPTTNFGIRRLVSFQMHSTRNQ